MVTRTRMQQQPQVPPVLQPVVDRLTADYDYPWRISVKGALETFEGNGLGDARVSVLKRKPQVGDLRKVPREAFDLTNGDHVGITRALQSGMSRLFVRALLDANPTSSDAFIGEGVAILKIGSTWIRIEEIPGEDPQKAMRRVVGTIRERELSTEYHPVLDDDSSRHHG